MIAPRKPAPRRVDMIGEHRGEHLRAGGNLAAAAPGGIVRAQQGVVAPEMPWRDVDADPVREVEFPRFCGVLSTCDASVAGRMDWNAEIEAAVSGAVPA